VDGSDYEQQIRDAMKLAPTAGDPAAGSIDAQVDSIQAKTDNIPASPAAVGSAMTLTAAYDAAKTAAQPGADGDTLKSLSDQIDSAALEATLTAIKGAGWSTETLKALADVLTAIKGAGWTTQTLKEIGDKTANLPANTSTELSAIAADAELAAQAASNDRLHDEESGEHVLLNDAGTAALKTFTAYSQVSITGANWTNATKYLTQTGVFASYRWKSGDTVTLTAGTGVTLGQYTIASRVSDDAIELATDINSTGGDISDDTVVGTIDPQYMLIKAT
jgi:hypothetical protein